MKFLRRFFTRLTSFVTRRRQEERLREEIEQHIALQTEENVRAGLSPLEARRLDALVHVARIRTTDPRRVVGAKPAGFCWWLFDLLGALPGDELVDLFPGSGGIGRAWRLYSSAGENRRNTRDDTSGAACG